MRNRRLRSRFRWLKPSLAVALVTSALAIEGQGTLDQLPAPIPGQDWERQIERLDPDDGQLDVAFQLHREYIESSKQLRETEIEAFLTEDDWMPPDTLPGSVYPVERVRRHFNARDRLLERIAGLDRRLFDRLAEHLREDQMQALRSLRARRAIERPLQMGTTSRWMGLLAHLDVRRLLQQADLAPEVRARFEAELVLHETRLAELFGTLTKSTESVVIAYMEELNAQGFVERPNSTSPQLSEFGQALLPAWWAARDEARDAAAEISRHEAEFLLSIAGRLSVADGYQLRQTLFDYPTDMRFFAFPGRGFDRSRHHAAHLFDLSLEQADLTDDERAAILELRRSYRLRWNEAADDVLREAVDVFAGRGHIVLPAGEREGIQRFQRDTLRGLRDRWATVQQDMALALRGIVGNDVIDEIEERRTQEREAARDAAREEEVFLQRLHGGAVTFLPSQIGSADLTRYVQLLQLDEDQRLLLHAAHEDYVADLGDIHAAHADDLQKHELGWQIVNIDPDSGHGELAAPSVEHIERAVEVKDRVLQAIEEIEQTFIDQLEAMCHPDQGAGVELVRFDRIVARHADYIADRLRDRTAYSERRTNWITVLMDAELSGAGRQRAMKHVRSRIPLISGVLRSQWEAHRDAERMYWTRHYLSRVMAQRGVPWHEISVSDFTVESKTAHDRLRETRRRLIDTNRSLLAEFVGTLDEDDAEALKHTYFRLAYPAVYDDPVDPLAPLEDALQRPDLTDQQLVTLNELYQSTRSEYETMSCEICEVYAKSLLQGNVHHVEDGWLDHLIREAQVEKIEFYRSELIFRALWRMRRMLGESA